jgi:hypothetical protein
LGIPNEETMTRTFSPLRQLCSMHSVAFGNLLLERAKAGSIPFHMFVEVAEDLIASAPQQTAVYLAALVALDMRSQTGPEMRPGTVVPSPN